MILVRIRDGARAPWTISEPAAKLAWRAALPGASTYDRAAQVLRKLQNAGTAAVDLLPLALPASWMVNTKATSRTMQRWLGPVYRDAWSALLEVLDPCISPASWLEAPDAERAIVAGAVSALASDSAGDGASLCAVTKVLALLRPQLVPLMDDAALCFALGAVPEPTTADTPSAPPDLFVPMLDWFAASVRDLEEPLTTLAAAHTQATLDAAQTLDRLLWMESWGERLRVRARG